MAKTPKERRAEEAAEAAAFEGRVDFPDSTTRPKRPGCEIPLYVVVWDAKLPDGSMRPSGNSWQSKKKAIEVRDRKIAAGTFRYTKTQYCGGFM